MLVHYTTPRGLDGILRSKSIWASDYRFLNDTREFRHGPDIFGSTFNEEKNRFDAGLMETVENFFRAARQTDKDSQCVFVASLSEAEDLLSQWRGYNHGRGFAVGFARQWLLNNAANQGFVLSPVIYDARAQREAVVHTFGLLKIALERRDEPRENDFNVLLSWWSRVLAVPAVLKDDSFAEEREYRLVKIMRSWPRYVQTRAVTGGLAPYILFDLKADPSFDYSRGFAHITIGPALRDRQIVAVDALLASQGMRIPIRRSSIPFADV